MLFFTYILKSQKDNRFYYGSTNNLEERLSKHNKGGIKSTKGRTPFTLHYSESYETRSEAFRREKFFKSIDGYLWLKKNEII